MYEDDPFVDPDFDELFKLVTIDKLRKKKITVALQDENGDEIELKTAVHQLVDYISDQLSINKKPTDRQNAMVNQIVPLVSQAMCSGLPRLLGERHAYMTISIEKFRHSTMMMMVLSLSLLKWVKQKNLKIITYEEDVTDEELEKMEKMSRISSAASTGAMLGMSPQEIIHDLIDSGDLDPNDLGKYMPSNDDDDDEE